MSTDEADSLFERWWAETPEGKLELIDGKLIISTLAGSRRILRDLLQDYGPALLLPMAPPSLWWQALQEAYTPHPHPATLDDWHAWADALRYEPEVAPAGPRGTSPHRRLYDILSWGLYYLSESSRLGLQLGRDFVIRLGENGPTPDLIFIDCPRLDRLRGRYLDGPPAIAVEITLPGSEDQDRVLKRRLYEQAGVPEFWLVEPERLEITFHQLQASGRYLPLVIGPQDLTHIVESKEDRIYHSVAVPNLSLSLLYLWTMKDRDRKEPWRPFLPVKTPPGDREPLPHGSGGIRWDEIPFAPRVDLKPVPVRFDEYISWCGRAKFESYGGGLKIDGTEGTRRVAGMLLMTFGLIEVVRLAHPREWITFLDRDRYLATVRQQSEILMRDAQFQRREFGKDEVYYRGAISQLPDLDSYGDSMDECRQALTEAVETWILLRIARREPLPEVE